MEPAHAVTPARTVVRQRRSDGAEFQGGAGRWQRRQADVASGGRSSRSRPIDRTLPHVLTGFERPKTRFLGSVGRIDLAHAQRDPRLGSSRRNYPYNLRSWPVDPPRLLDKRAGRNYTSNPSDGDVPRARGRRRGDPGAHRRRERAGAFADVRADELFGATRASGGAVCAMSSNEVPPARRRRSPRARRD